MYIKMTEGKLFVDADTEDWYDIAYAIDEYLYYLEREPALGLHTQHPIIQLREALRWAKP